MSNVVYPLKHLRLQQLSDAGFNVADFISFPPRQLDEKKLRELFEKHGKISLRHFHADESRHFKCPFFPDQTDWETILKLAREHNQNFYALYNECLAPEDSLSAGHIMLQDDRNYLVEYFEGPGTPRDFDSHPNLKRFSREVGMPMDPSAPEALKRLAFKFKGFVPYVRPIIIEFSIYPYPVGRLKTFDVAWEWRLG